LAAAGDRRREGPSPPRASGDHHREGPIRPVANSSSPPVAGKLDLRKWNLTDAAPVGVIAQDLPDTVEKLEV
jgi:hypothetical protein